ncbi:MAG: hypothetical protein CML68_08810, partial [Rhodobacteraceae bacterium]|nr:hypothetical protein [Paracoccaceae bacterium]
MSRDIEPGRGGANGSRTDSNQNLASAVILHGAWWATTTAAVLTTSLAASTGPAAAQSGEPDLAVEVGRMLTDIDILYLSAIAFLIGAAMVAATFMVRQRAGLSAENEALRSDLHQARLEADARTALL